MSIVNSSFTSDSSSAGSVMVYTPNEMLRKGLLLAGYKKKSIKRCKKSTNLERFSARYGANPVVLAHIWEDLQTNPTVEYQVPREKLKLDYFFMAIHFLKRYPEEHERAATYGWHRDTCRDWSWYYVEKICDLKHIKIVWPEEEDGEPIWFLTVDGQHCWMHEPQHPEWSQDSDWFSHKYNKAGVDYELGVSLTKGLIWMNGPFKAGQSDLKVFREKGLLDKLRGLKQKAIADGGYHDQDLFDVISPPNALDDPLVKKFKRRALKRHEKFNGMTKEYDCLSERFRHSPSRFGDCFEAVCVITQYKLEHGSPLYNILVEGMT